MIRLSRAVMRRSPRLRRWRRYWFRPLMDVSGVLLRVVCLADLMAAEAPLARALQDSRCGLPRSIRRTGGG